MDTPRITPDEHDDPLPRLPWGVRVALLGLGWILVLIGILGLALPGIQGILTLALGAAVLSLASRSTYRFLRRRLQRWPAAWDRIERFRARVYRFLSGRAASGPDRPA